MSERIYRDPVHNIIRLRTDTAEGALLVRLIDTPEFQRLRRIKQLGLALYTYQGAEHSRFAHSLGVLHLVRRVLDKLSERYEIKEDDRAAVCAAALLHDIGHGSFSHVMEAVAGFHHEAWTIAAVLSEATQVNRVLREYSEAMPARVASVIDGTFRPNALAQLVSSQLDVDRMDYLLRDSLMTGAKYGIYDLEWIINALAIDEANDRTYVMARGLYAVEEYLQARYYMFRQVYFHRTLRSAEAVLRSILRRAFELVTAGNESEMYLADDTAFARMIHGATLTLADHLEMDDADVMFHVKQWQRARDPILRDLSCRFIERRLFKAVDLDMPPTERTTFVCAAREAVEAAGFDAAYYFVEDQASDVPHTPYHAPTDTLDERKRIYVEDGYARPVLREITEVSQVARGLERGYKLHRICFPPEVKADIYRLYRTVAPPTR
ncbi:MAG: HD domain-containing protein [Pyrinomonadaceae bacterium MAG19_C2-C3]|nr:HD domain-containing protein [Pyrinomonadaceae bacterium MAG19_C2-C3]